jgi:hypothetical protein
MGNWISLDAGQKNEHLNTQSLKMNSKIISIVPVQFDYGPLRLKPNTLPTWLSVPLHIAM